MKKIDIQQTGKHLKNLCHLHGITVKDIQKELYIGSFQSIYAWFSGKSLPTLENIYGLSGLLGIPVDRLIISERNRIWENTPASRMNLERMQRRRVYEYYISMQEFAG